MVPVESKYILKDSWGPVKEELPCAQRIEVAEGQDIRWNEIIRDKCSSTASAFFDKKFLRFTSKI